MARGSPSRIHISIISGGLAGAAFANGLTQIPHLDIQILLLAKESLAKAGAVPIDTFGMSTASSFVHRASLRGLLALILKVTLHTSKKLTSLNPTDDGIEVIFEDGTIDQFDAVIGADGFCDCRCLVPYEEGKVVLGEELFVHDRQVDLLEEIAMCRRSYLVRPFTDRKRLPTEEALTRAFGSLLEGPIAKKTIDISLLAQCTV
ncbi:FAD/NAD(P)-binding domain-containing protein [Hypoxylon crocopeplum]|nr:FAD/NAD(P)-binding domain-containing protein [Hypoxylon crocopeplum]